MISQNKQVLQLRRTHQDVLQKIDKLSKLNTQYRSNQQKQFLKTFLHVMDRMSSQLSQAQQLYINIDKEIEKDEKCVQLSTKLKFFKQQCLVLRSKLDQTQQQLKLEKQRQNQIFKQNKQLQENLFKKSKQLFKYKAKAYSLTKRRRQTSQFGLTNFNKIGVQTDYTQSPKCKHSFSFSQNIQRDNLDSKERKNIVASQKQQKIEKQFLIKAEKISKQRKLIMNRINLTEKKKLHQINKQNCLSSILK